MVRFSGTRSCGDINYLKFSIRIFEFLQKCPGPLGLNLLPKFWILDILVDSQKN